MKWSVSCIPAAMAFLGLSFIVCALLVTGLPPLSGFIAKFMILSAALDTAPLETGVAIRWVLWAAVLGSGLIGVIALSKMGIRLFWSSDEIVTPQLHLIEAAPVAMLLLLTWGYGGSRAGNGVSGHLPGIRFLAANVHRCRAGKRCFTFIPVRIWGT